ncbi:MAG: tRNA (adenosine(37)-N6)-threonylcarbamoyltransferase complex ATPase subunit type 1 TsaE [Clostridiales bacterium]|nr:tRNA (adenosine(37)-N6)-threonylcarbamoyltransferase complex ATPase subunit type 1 TsaE [Clostridiales bacterium]MDU1042468.1 tRNA (adenosine(37)-N6)-threonylcarbamoyltransferase complex ATPase subunit type 1 TsaE [Clostridiales bacterium]MDU3489760.1 tRNA (adenosine(37)-N6)-threonylcarbamoyltransferase complex ATPase subunit type 1 TsaE [Clostridiales bacterium]
MIYESFSRQDTYKLGMQLAEEAKQGDIFTLSGDLGAGKTAFSKGFAHGLGVEDEVTSPTFTIVCEYGSGRIPLYHFDMYRLADGSELEDIGAEEYLYGNGVCLIEWPENVEGYLPEQVKKIKIEKDLEKGPDYRKITIEE